MKPDHDLTGATISRDGLYRFALWRVVDPLQKRRTVLFVMNNPSTADHRENDPTIQRCKGFTMSWGYHKLLVGNVNPTRATDPKAATVPPAEILERNDRHLGELVVGADLIVCAWGAAADPNLVKRAWPILSAGGKFPTCLALTQGGSPRHPLYLKAELKPKRLRLDPDRLDAWQ